MDLDLTSNQELFVETSTRFMEATYPLSAVRANAPEADPGPEYRRQAAELGWFAMLVPEDRGGGSVSGNGVLDAAFIGDCGIDLAQNCFQVFGKIVYTWEHDQHLYLRRLTTDAALYGDPAWHRERLCQLAGLESVKSANGCFLKEDCRRD